MLVQLLYDNLEDEKEDLTPLYNQTLDSIEVYYTNDDMDKKDLNLAIHQSEILKDYFDAVKHAPNNQDIIDALVTSNTIYKYNYDRQWYHNNLIRSRYMKANLKKMMDEENFDLQNDKLLMKMGGYHSSKGFNPNYVFDIGNTLNELADFHGNSCINIGFSNRYYMDGDTLRDILDSDKRWDQTLKEFDQMGKKDKWVLIDLRPMTDGYYYYPRAYKLRETIKDYIRRYDFLVITKTEIEGTPNYD